MKRANGSGRKFIVADFKTTRRFLLRIFSGVVIVLLFMTCFILANLFRESPAMEPMEFDMHTRSQEDGVVRMQGALRRNISQNECLWLYAENAEIEVRTGGETFRYNEWKDTPAMFHSPGSGWYKICSSGITAGDTAEISVRSYYGENNRAADLLLREATIGDEGGLYRAALRQLNFFDVVLICSMIAGVLYLLEGAVYILTGVFNDGIRIAVFGFYCLIGSLWCVTNSLYPYLTLFIAPPWAANVLDMLGALLFPLAFIAMMCCYIRGVRTRRLIRMILAIEMMVVILCLVCQTAGYADLMEQQLFISSIALFSLCVALACLVTELYRYRGNSSFLLILTALPIFVGTVADGVNLIWPFMSQRVLMRYSFFVSIMFLSLQLVSYAQAMIAKTERSRRMESELVNSRISIMLSQIQPHFLYNALMGIKQLCDTDPKRASDALEHFSYYLRGNLDSLADAKLIPFDKEMEHLRDYLYLEKMRFSQKLNIVYELFYQDFMIPPLTVQAIAENAVRYGIVKKKGGGTLTLRSERRQDLVVVTISDDGVGFESINEKKEDRTHLGIENVRNRVEMQCGGTLFIESKIGVGTTVQIVLPQREGISCELL